MTALSAHYAERLNLAGTRDFAKSGAGAERRARLMAFGDDYLRATWQQGLITAGVPHDSGVALAVVGSQARGDAGPLSDYDIVLLHDGKSAGSHRVKELADALWYPMWDAGVRFDHSVRTLAECRKVASSDLSAAVGLLDIRVVAGDAALVSTVREGIANDWRGAARKRLPELLDSLHERHARFGDLMTSQDPDLKEAGGGLRDISIIGALTTAWLADPNRSKLASAQATLLDVRDAAHVVTGRGRERLMLQDQDAVAALLGLHDSDELLTEVVDAGRTITFIVDGAIRAAGQSQRARTLRVGPRKPTLTPLGHGLHLHDGEVVLGAGKREGGYVQLFRAGAAAASRNAAIAPTTLYNLTASLSEPEVPWPTAVRESFVEMLATGPGLVGVWEALDHAGVIDSMLPVWKKVRSRPQRNAVHKFTVDRHIIETVVAATALRESVARADLLLVAALFHDIGKIAGSRDHSEEGAPLARSMSERMGFDQDDASVIEILVRQHLTLVDLATKRDPDDPATIAALGAAVEGRADILALLLALTEADARAAGEKAWTPWRAGLIKNLAARAQAQLAQETGAPIPPESETASALLSADEEEAVRAGEVIVKVHGDAEGADVTIIDTDRRGLFADMAGVLGMSRSYIRSATVRTLGGLAINTWRIESPHGEAPDVEGLTRALRKLSSGDRSPVRSLETGKTPSSSTFGGSMVRASAFVLPGASVDATVIEVRAEDRPGLLFDVGTAFADAGASVKSAHIATYAGQSADTFYVINEAGEALDPPQAARVIAAVIDAASAS